MHARTKLAQHTRTLVDLDSLATRKQNVRWLNEAMVPLATRQQNVRWLNEAMAATLASHLTLQ